MAAGAGWGARQAGAIGRTQKAAYMFGSVSTRRVDRTETGTHLRHGESAAQSESERGEPSWRKNTTRPAKRRRRVFGYMFNVSTIHPRVTFLNGLTRGNR